MRITFSANEKIEMFMFGEDITVGNVEEIVFPSMGVTGRQKWFLNGRLLQTTNKDTTLKTLNVVDGDLITLVEEERRPAPAALTATGRNVRPRQNEPVYFDGMDFNDVLHYNPNPLMAVRVFRGHPQIARQLAFHNQKLADGIMQAATDDAAADVLRDFLLFQTVNFSMAQIEEQDKDKVMQERLQADPNDAEALAYMEDKQNEELINTQHRTMMHEYPETMFPVLMLYINTKINGIPVQAFVDSGAQTSVMTLACAKKCGIDKLIDKRAAGKVVGVGQSSTLGKIYIVPIQIEQSFFPMSVTVMESLGDKNMEFLFGLDMLRRHRFCIDLARGELTFHEGSNVCATPFLHEKDLPQHKGGTQGFDPNQPIKQHEAEDEEEEEVAIKKALEESVKEGEEESDAQVAETSASMEVEDQPSANVAMGTADDFEQKVQYLCSMGYGREAVERVLRQVDGDVETALTCLMFEG